MRTIFQLIAFAAASLMAPAALSAQAAPATPSTNNAAPQAATTASPAQSLPGQALPAQPQDASGMNTPSATGEEPDDEQVARASAAARTSPTVGVGQPDGRAELQEQFTPVGQRALWFHNVLLMPIITIICIFVLILMAIVIIRFRRSANPVPSRTSHNTTLEVLWTLLPVLILVIIAVPSIGLLREQYSPPRADITIKAIGNQWYWEYEYPDHGIQLVSNMLPDEQATAGGEPRQLAVDERMVVPAGATVKMIVTSNDVIHAWGIPSFWTKIDAVPGRLNETWFRTDQPGLYYGVCYELCGARHGYMPIAVEVLPPAQFAAWVASKGGRMPVPGQRPTATPPAGNARPGVTAGAPTEAAPGANVSAGTATPPVTNQGSASNEDGN